MDDAPLVAVLAAGRASRFGGGKLDANCAGQPLGSWVLHAVAAAGLPAGVIVTGPDTPAFARNAGWTLLANPLAEQGLGTSVAAAAQEAIRSGASSLLVLLADMPLVSAAYLRRIVANPAPAATRYTSGRPGVPALFGPDLLPLLAGLDKDRGAAVVLAGRADVTLLDPQPGMLADVDTAEDMALVEAAIRRAP